MSKSVNVTFLLGNVGKAPEIKYTTGGTAIASFSLATTKKFKDKSGEYQEKTSWHNCKAFGKTAEIVEKYVDKGKQLYLRGEIDYQSWDDKETGQKKYRTEIIVDELVLLGGGKSGGDEYDQRRAGTDETGSQVRPAADVDEDISF